MDKLITDNSSNEYYNIPKNDKITQDKKPPMYEDIDDFIFDDEKTIPSER